MARFFNGNSNFITIGSGINLNAISYSIHIWLKVTSAFYVGSWEGPGARGWLLSGDTSSVGLALNGGGNVLTGSMVGSVWKPVGITWDTGVDEGRMYVGGSLAAGPTNIGDINQDSVYRINWAAPAICEYAEFAVWSGTALSASDMTSLAGGARADGIHFSNLAGYWPICGDNSPEPDFGSVNQLGTITGTAPKTDHPIFSGICGNLPIVPIPPITQAVRPQGGLRW